MSATREVAPQADPRPPRDARLPAPALRRRTHGGRREEPAAEEAARGERMSPGNGRLTPDPRSTRAPTRTRSSSTASCSADPHIIHIMIIYIIYNRSSYTASTAPTSILYIYITLDLRRRLLLRRPAPRQPPRRRRHPPPGAPPARPGRRRRRRERTVGGGEGFDAEAGSGRSGRRRDGLGWGRGGQG